MWNRFLHKLSHHYFKTICYHIQRSNFMKKLSIRNRFTFKFQTYRFAPDMQNARSLKSAFKLQDAFNRTMDSTPRIYKNWKTHEYIFPRHVFQYHPANWPPFPYWERALCAKPAMQYFASSEETNATQHRRQTKLFSKHYTSVSIFQRKCPESYAAMGAMFHVPL